MPSWSIHCKYAQKMGIPEYISNYVNVIIDVIPTKKREDSFPPPPKEIIAYKNKFIENLYADYPNQQDYIKCVINKCEKFGINSYVILHEMFKHDIGGKKKSVARIAVEIQVGCLSLKGQKYVDAWYLHHALDYFYDHLYDFGSDDFKTLAMHFLKNRPIDFPMNILIFLRDNWEDIKNDLNNEKKRKTKNKELRFKLIKFIKLL